MTTGRMVTLTAIDYKRDEKTKRRLLVEDKAKNKDREIIQRTSASSIAIGIIV